MFFILGQRIVGFVCLCNALSRNLTVHEILLFEFSGKSEVNKRWFPKRNLRLPAVIRFDLQFLGYVTLVETAGKFLHDLKVIKIFDNIFHNSCVNFYSKAFSCIQLSSNWLKRK